MAVCICGLEARKLGYAESTFPTSVCKGPKVWNLGLVITAAIALMGIVGIVWACIVLGVWLFRARELKRREPGSAAAIDRNNELDPNTARASESTTVELLVVLILIGILIAMLFPTLFHSSEGRVRTENSNQTRQLVLAVLNYESDHSHLPPAYIADENGKPMHSWRVLILPYLDQQSLFDQYDFDEPWDGPNNAKLVNQLHEDLFDAWWDDKANGLTCFKLVTGEGTAFERGQTIKLDEISGGASNKIMIVYDNSKPVNWMAPEDIAIDDAIELFDSKNKNMTGRIVVESKFSKETTYFSNIGMFDGTVESAGFLHEPSWIRDNFLIASTLNPIHYLVFQSPGHENEMKGEGYLLVGINAFLALLPAWWIRGKAYPKDQ